ncbi:hypothetical protein M011DRAFT_480825 [Sporormia fimetaria CBS 119925]|uniref:Uncharacterized protein n=1 Tax=Sporormia fimetaria CBS 119925 TaxID=1340428 RepID=A0A6A6V1H3_9PLEO|nr:hypothetical protein M011DRAFT_480825 [Sporormia fimetaria CBS 119925]
MTNPYQVPDLHFYLSTRLASIGADEQDEFMPGIIAENILHAVHSKYPNFDNDPNHIYLLTRPYTYPKPSDEGMALGEGKQVIVKVLVDGEMKDVMSSAAPLTREGEMWKALGGVKM